MLTARRVLWTAVLFLLVIVLAAHAHKPVSIGGTYATHGAALWMDEIDVSQVVYAELDDTHRAVWLTFDIAAPTTLDLSLGVPVIERLADYRPSICVVGPGLPPVYLPFEVPSDGGIVFETSSAGDASFFHEPFTGTDSWILLKTSVDLPQPGIYHVVAWAPGELSGKLWVAIGRREQFGFADILSFGSIIREVRSFHEAAPRLSSSAVIGKLLFLGLTAALIAFLVSGSGF